MLFDQTPQFASDLDWMLQSGQASRELILEALVEEYGNPLYALALSILDDEAAARSVSRQVFVNALLDIHGYRDHIGVDVWFYRIALQSCQRELARLQARRSLKALLPLPRKEADFGLSTPETELDAALWLALDDLDGTSRLVVLLHYMADWEIPKISAVLEIDEHELQSGLKSSLEELAAALVDLDETEQEEGDSDEIVRRSLARRWPHRELPPLEGKQALPAILRRVGRGGARRRGFSLVKELAFIVLVILLVGGAIWGANILWPEPEPTPKVVTVIVTKLVDARRMHKSSTSTPAPRVTPTHTPLPKDVFYEVRPGNNLHNVAEILKVPVDELRELNRLPVGSSLFVGQRLLIPGSLPTLTAPRATPVPFVPQVAPLKEPLTSDDILNRILLAGMLFHTAWFDAQVIDYGPVGYVGPPHTRRAQMWLGQDQFLALIGGEGNQVELALVHEDGHLYLAKPAEGQPWFFEWQMEVAERDEKLDNLVQLLDTLDYRYQLGQDSRFEARDRQILAERQTLVVDEIDAANRRTARFWLDDRTGLVLRRIAYSPDGDDVPLQEVNVTAIAYNIDLPQSLLDRRLPWRGGFAQDHTGAPIQPNDAPRPLPEGRTPLLAESLPEGFDPSHSRLTFQYLREIGFMEGAVMNVFADSYLLNMMVYSDPWTMICERSPNGERMAYVSRPRGSVYSGASHLQWFSLKDAVTHNPLQSLAVTEFAFSPDSQQLALFGRGAEKWDLDLIVLNMDHGETRTLLTLGDARSLVWSPDGERLAFIARLKADSFEEHIVVINANTGAIEYNSSIDFEHRQSGEWPTKDWGVPFPVEMGALEACVQPPQ